MRFTWAMLALIAFLCGFVHASNICAPGTGCHSVKMNEFGSSVLYECTTNSGTLCDGYEFVILSSQNFKNDVVHLEYEIDVRYKYYSDSWRSVNPVQNNLMNFDMKVRNGTTVSATTTQSLAYTTFDGRVEGLANVTYVRTWKGVLTKSCPNWNHPTTPGCIITLAYGANTAIPDRRFVMQIDYRWINMNTVGPSVSASLVWNDADDKTVPLALSAPQYGVVGFNNTDIPLEASIPSTGCYTTPGGSNNAQCTTYDDGSFSCYGGIYNTGVPLPDGRGTRIQSNVYKVPVGTYHGTITAQCQLSSGFINVIAEHHNTTYGPNPQNHRLAAHNFYAAANQFSVVIPFTYSATIDPVVPWQTNNYIMFDGAANSVESYEGCCMIVQAQPSSNYNGSVNVQIPDSMTVSVSNPITIANPVTTVGVSGISQPVTVNFSTPQHVVVDSGAVTANLANAAITLGSGSEVSIVGTTDVRLVSSTNTDKIPVRLDQTSNVNVQNVVSVTSDIGFNTSVLGYEVKNYYDGPAVGYVLPFGQIPQDTIKLATIENATLHSDDYSMSTYLIIIFVYMFVIALIVAIILVKVFPVCPEKKQKLIPETHGGPPYISFKN